MTRPPETAAPSKRTSRKGEISTARVLKAALDLFARQGFRATTMRQIARRTRLSLGNLYHHFGNKEQIFQRLIDAYWERLLDPELPLNRIYAEARFPDDLPRVAEAIEQVVEENAQSILLIYIDVIEFRGKHIRAFYAGMKERFAASYRAALAQRKADGEIEPDVDPLVAVMLATRWLFYFFTVEKCFGVPMHMGLEKHQAVDEFIKILRLGVLPRRTGREGRES